MIAMPAIYPVTAHTQHVGRGSTFVAIKGFKEDGIVYIPEALKRGATTIVVAHDAELTTTVFEMIADYKAELVRVENTRHTLAALAAAAAGYPARSLKIIGFTGTKGKTTSVYLLEHILRTSGIKTARITGISNMIDGVELPANLTTPQPDYLHQFLKLCVEVGVTHLVMEVAAQALSLNRVNTIVFDAALFTNLGREHFELYETMEEYCAVKACIFEHVTLNSLCLVNAHDAWARTVQNPLQQIHSYGIGCGDVPYRAEESAAYPASIVRNGISISCPSLIGNYNAQNLLGVVLVAERYGLSSGQINRALETFGSIPGRMERYQLPKQVTAIIDYAHNPSSYEAFLSTLRPMTTNLIVVFGASGTRDKGKRPLMGAMAAQFADTIILTSDNPGPEDPREIIACIKAGIPVEKQNLVREEVDRAAAIALAYTVATPGSIIALLGKGPDEYQMIKGQKYVFRERDILQQLKGQDVV